MKCTKRIRKIMIHPSNKRLQKFHVLLCLTLCCDIFMTSLLIGNYKFINGEIDEYLSHQ